MSKLNIEHQQTPDPNVMNFTTNRTLNPGAARAFYNAESAESDPVARDFFAITGVAGLFIINDFCSIHKAASVPWEDLIPKIEAVIRRRWDESP